MDWNECPTTPEYALYRKIYALNKKSRGKSKEEILKFRSQMKPIFEQMLYEATSKVNNYSSKSQIAKAYNYFINAYEGLIVFLTHPEIPIDNNHHRAAAKCQNQSEGVLFRHLI